MTPATRDKARCAAALGLPLALLASVPLPAYAYIDPVTGSFLFQGIVGAIAGGLYLIKVNWRKLKQLVAGKPGAEETSRQDAVD